MNSLNTLGNRQVASLNADLAKMEAGDIGPSIQGGSFVSCFPHQTPSTRKAKEVFDSPSTPIITANV